LRGELWEKAAESLRQAGAKATARSAHREATLFFERALDATAHLPASRPTSELSLQLLFDLRVSLFVLGEDERLMKCLADARAIAVALDDKRHLARVLAYQANQYTHVGDPRRGAEAGEQALVLARTLQDFSLQMVASVYTARAYAALGDYARALEYASAVRAALQGERALQRMGTVTPPGLTSRIIMSQCLNERGEFRDSIAYAEEACQLAEPLASDPNLAATGWTLAKAYLLAGRAEQAVSILERGMAMSRDRSAFSWPHIMGDLGYAYALTGRLQDAIPLLEEATRERCFGNAAYRRLPWLWLGEVYLRAGRQAEAAITAERVLGECRRYQERGNEAKALRLCGEVAAGATHRTRSRPSTTTSRRAPSPTNWACARSWPTATSASARSTTRSTATPTPRPS
jgi:tetratricopeptide (TPR) repeat protein